MVFTYKDSINIEGFGKISEFLSENWESNNTIYFSSEGGEAQLIPLFLDLFEKYGYNTELVGYSDLFSSGFEIFFLAKVKKKRLLNYVLGMYHQASAELYLNENGLLVNGQELSRFRNLTRCSKDMTKLMLDTVNFTAKERKQLLSGETLFFDNDRMKKFKL